MVTWDQLTVEAESAALGDGDLRALAEADNGLRADGDIVGDGGGLVGGDLARVALQWHL